MLHSLKNLSSFFVVFLFFYVFLCAGEGARAVRRLRTVWMMGEWRRVRRSSVCPSRAAEEEQVSPGKGGGRERERACRAAAAALTSLFQAPKRTKQENEKQRRKETRTARHAGTSLARTEARTTTRTRSQQGGARTRTRGSSDGSRRRCDPEQTRRDPPPACRLARTCGRCPARGRHRAPVGPEGPEGFPEAHRSTPRPPCTPRRPDGTSHSRLTNGKKMSAKIFGFEPGRF